MMNIKEMLSNGANKVKVYGVCEKISVKTE